MPRRHDWRHCTYQLALLQHGVLLDDHVLEHDSVLDDEDGDGGEGEEDGLEEEDPLALGGGGVEAAEAVGDGGDVRQRGVADRRRPAASKDCQNKKGILSLSCCVSFGIEL